MAICMTGRGRMIWLMATAFLSITKTAQSTKDIGLMIYAMARARRCGLMARSLKAATKQARSMELAYLNGLMEVAIMATFYRMIFTAKAPTSGPTAENTPAIGI